MISPAKAGSEIRRLTSPTSIGTSLPSSKCGSVLNAVFTLVPDRPDGVEQEPRRPFVHSAIMHWTHPGLPPQWALRASK